MKLKKVLLVLLFPYMAQCLLACCPCQDVVYNQYTNKELTIYSLDNSGQSAILAMTDSIPKTAYGIRMVLKAEKTAGLLERPVSLFASANAFSCDCPPELQFRAADSITSIRIITVNGFDAAHPAGADVTSYFKFYDSYQYIALEGIAQKASAVYTEDNMTLMVDLMLLQPPTQNTDHQFRLQITLSDNRVLEQRTNVVKLY